MSIDSKFTSLQFQARHNQAGAWSIHPLKSKRPSFVFTNQNHQWLKKKKVLKIPLSQKCLSNKANYVVCEQITVKTATLQEKQKDVIVIVKFQQTQPLK